MNNVLKIIEIMQEILPKKIVEEMTDKSKGEERVKKFTVLRHINTLMYAHLREKSGLREIASGITASEELQEYTGTISYSQISRVNASREVELFGKTFEAVCGKLMSMTPLGKIPGEYGVLKAVDSTLVKLCLSIYPWAKYRDTIGGVKIHTLYDILNGCPESVILTDGLTHDKTQMTKFINTPGVTYLFDRAYLDYGEFDRYCNEGIYFVSRLKKNAIITVLDERPLSDNGNILSEKTVILGGYSTKMSNSLILIEVVDLSSGESFDIVTNRADLTAKQIADIYRLRWEIETFFKWIKQHLKIKKFYGTSFNAILIQIFTALILYCILKIIHIRYCRKFAFLAMVRFIADSLFITVDYLVKCLTPAKTKTKPKRLRRNPLDGYKEVLLEYGIVDSFI